MRRVTARWPISAKFRSAAITAASTRRPSSSCSRAPISNAPAISRPCADCGRNIEAALEWIERVWRPRRRRFRRIRPPQPRGSRQPGMEGQPRRHVSTPTDRWRKPPIALAEVQAYVYGAWRAAAEIARRLAHDHDAHAYDGKAEAIRGRVRPALLRRGARHLRPGARRRQAAVSGEGLERRPCAFCRHRPARARGARSSTR